MNKQDLAEIRKRINPDKCSVDVIHGCYVDNKKNIICEFKSSLMKLSQDEVEKYMAIFRKTLSGTQDKNLVDVEFRPDQVMEGDHHQLLTGLRNTGLKVNEGITRLFESIASGVAMEDNYVILMIHDTYDVPYKYKDGSEGDGGAESEKVFEYILCALCPVKQAKTALSYDTSDQSFHEFEPLWTIAAPELGFMFPEYEDGGANIYRALYYTKNPDSRHEDFVSAVFDVTPPMPSTAQKETFDTMLSDVLQDDCKLEVVQSVHEQICERIEEMKSDKTAEAPTVSKKEVSSVLKECGVPEEKVTAFEEAYEEQFGPQELKANVLVDTRKFEVRTPDVVVRVSPDKADLLQTRMIDGSQYILIRADEGVEVNGVKITMEGLGEEA